MALALGPGDDPRGGYYGHLTKHQEGVLKDMKALLTKDGYKLASLDDEAHGRRSEGVSDLELLRFLRARRFDLQKAYAMYMAAIKWRKEIDLDKLYETFDWDEAHRASRVGYVQYFHKTDRSGSPIHIHELHTIDLNKLFKAITPENQVRYMFLLNESNFRERFPGCTEELRRKAKEGNGERPSSISSGSSSSKKDMAELSTLEKEALEIQEVETVTGILDVKGVGLMGFWKVKDLLGQVIQISDNYYPETSNRMFIINAPSMFATIFGYIKGWLDERTASRIFVLGSDYQATLLQHIAPENLPSHFGGKCKCEGLERGCRNGDVGCWNSHGK